VDPYDPVEFWTSKARKAEGDYFGAVATGSPIRDICIDRVQKRLMKKGVRRLGRCLDMENARVLDYGCGVGRWASFFQNMGTSYAGVDISPEMISLARRHHGGVNFVELEDGRIPFPAAEFDLVVSMAVIHHNRYEDQQVILDEILRVLKPDGCLVLFEGIGKRSTSADAIYYYRSANEWRELAGRRGFAVRWSATTRYWTLHTILEKLSDWLTLGAVAKRGGLAKMAPRASRLILHLDAWIDPYLISLLPERLQGRLFLVLERIRPKPA
jgi:SAM-dependent methyltransferase